MEIRSLLSWVLLLSILHDSRLLRFGMANWNCSSRTKAEASRSLGWKPSKTEEDWRNGFQTDVEAILRQQK